MIAAKPLPDPTDASRPFWDACRRHELRIQRCLDCGSLIHYPKIHCPKDGGERFEWALMSGRGSVYSFIVCHRAFHESFKPEVPYVVAVIELEEGVRLMSNVIGVDPDDVHVGMAVAVEFEDVNESFSLPKFRPASSGGTRR